MANGQQVENLHSPRPRGDDLGDGGTSAIAGPIYTVDPNWRSIGTGDFNGDGKSDILWQSLINSAVTIREMDGTSATGDRSIPLIRAGIQ